LSNIILTLFALLSLMILGMILFFGRRSTEELLKIYGLLITSLIVIIFYWWSTIGLSSITTFLYRLLTSSLSTLNKWPYDYWNFSWRIGILTLILMPAGIFFSWRKRGFLFTFFIVWLILSFTFYFGEFLGLYWDPLRFLELMVFPCTFFASRGLSQLSIRYDMHKFVYILILNTVILTQSCLYVSFAKESVSWYLNHQSTLLPP
jgi:hypothetical protein